jgi:hypothetical protein
MNGVCKIEYLILKFYCVKSYVKMILNVKFWSLEIWFLSCNNKNLEFYYYFWKAKMKPGIL